MAEIIKTQGLVLSKLEYSESSKIARIYTKDKGKISVIVKAARSAKSKTGKIVDPLNIIELVYYEKPTREIQLVSDTALIEHFPNLRADFNATIYATAIAELIDKLIHAEEVNERLFRGALRILQLMDKMPEFSQTLFVKFLFFFSEVLGYELNFNSCSSCKADFTNENKVGFNYEKGFLCKKCSTDEFINFSFDKEHYKIMKCLTSRNFDCGQNEKTLWEIISFMEKYLAYQIEEFAEIKTIKLIIN
jgi:DNA repair protein RecO (recombination protein O)